LCLGFLAISVKKLLMPIVYCAVNIVNGKSYIGVTRKTLNKRKYSHYSSRNDKNKRCRIFARAILKYGMETFSWFVLSEHNTIDEAFSAEKRAIKDLKPEYNISSGGPGVSRLPPESRNAISCSRRRPVICISHNRRFESGRAAASYYGIDANRIVQICKGGGKTRAGLEFRYADGELPTRIRKISEERLKEMAFIRKAARNRAVERNSKKVMCVDDGLTHKSLSAAARFYGLRPSLITDAIRRGGKSGGKAFMMVQ
jgi:group I intron endonuclease